MTYYAYTPAVSSSGEIESWGADLKPGHPAAEMVALTLRTRKGSCAADPDDGVDVSVVETAQPNTGARWKSEVERALSRFVRNGLISNLLVSVEVDGDRLLYDVEFNDPRDTREPVRLKRLTLP